MALPNSFAGPSGGPYIYPLGHCLSQLFEVPKKIRPLGTPLLAAWKGLHGAPTQTQLDGAYGGPLTAPQVASWGARPILLVGPQGRRQA